MDASESDERPARSRALILFVPILAFLLATVPGSPILAAPPSPPTPPAMTGDDVREALRVLMIVSMKRVLELSPGQETAVVPKIEQIFNERERYAREHQEVLRKVQVKLAQAAVPDRDFRESVLRLDQMEKRHRELEARLRAEIDRSLTARQQAQLRLFAPRFREEMQGQIDQARRILERRSGRPAPGAVPLPEGLPFSDDEEF